MGYEVDFLAVGEESQSGDAISLRFGNLNGARKEQFVAVIDGGFKESGQQMVDHIKKYYHTTIVDLAILTHPDADHASGLEVVVNELSVKKLWMHQPWNHTENIASLFKDGRVTDNSIREEFRKSLESAWSLEKVAKSKGIPILEPFTGLADAGGYLYVVGPTQEYYETLLPGFSEKEKAPEFRDMFEEVYAKLAEVAKKIAESWGYESLDDTGETTATNNSSVIIAACIDNKILLFTGDAGIPALTQAADILNGVGVSYTNISFMQVPHHGSKRNIGPTVLNRLIGPKLGEDKKIKTAFVSAAKESGPKHPARKVTNAFRRRGAPVCTTKGVSIWHYHEAPQRANYSPIQPLPFYDEVED